MPSDTFLRLPEEKRRRFLDAAWEEFTGVKFMDASINNIIRRAGISRGSFYQYFEDKEDVFLYLLEGVRDHVLDKTYKAVVEHPGGLFEAPVFLFEELRRQKVLTDDPEMIRYIQVLNINPRMDLQQFFVGAPEELVQLLVRRTDLSDLRDMDLGNLKEAIEMIIYCLATAIVGSLAHPERIEEEREALERRVKIIHYGCCREEKTGGAVC